MPELGCTQIVEDRERDGDGKLIIIHRLCGRPAAEVTIGQKAILCEEHLREAMRQTELSRRGHPVS